MSSQVGDGAGKGGGAGGPIREAMAGRREVAQEDEYFHRQQNEQLTKIKDNLNDEISFHEEQVKRHEEAIARNKQRVAEIQPEKK